VAGNYDISLHNTGFTNNTGLGWTVAKSDTLSNVSLSSSWRLLGSCVISSTPANTQRTNINPTPGNDSTSFNHFYTTVQTNTAPLPVELLFFTAEPYGEKVLCKWETASETNNDYFDVEKSSNGTEFEKIGRVRGFGQGTSSESRKYSFIDPDLCLDIRYYRLKQVDIDGETSYSNDVAVNCREIKDKIVVYPNPANNIVTCSFYENKSGIVRLQWIDLIGKTVKEELISVIKGYNTIQTDVSTIARGIYYMRIKEIDKDSFENNKQIKFLKN
jgi:hypothetical protein